MHLDIEINDMIFVRYAHHFYCFSIRFVVQFNLSFEILLSIVLILFLLFIILSCVQQKQLT